MIRLAFCLILAALPAAAHEWYPLTCCSSRDCFPIEATDLEPVSGGYRIRATGEVIPWDQVRVTPEEGGDHFHRCSWGGDPDGRTIGLGLGKACFWAPQAGF